MSLATHVVYLSGIFVQYFQKYLKSFSTGIRGQVSKLISSLRTSSPVSPTSPRSARLVYRLRLSNLCRASKIAKHRKLSLPVFAFAARQGFEPSRSRTKYGLEYSF